MKNKTPYTPLTDDYLNSLEGMHQVETSDFFYTRLQSKMSVTRQETNWPFALKPVWALAVLTLLLLLNAMVLLQQGQKASPASPGSLQDFASAYDQTLSPSF